MTQRDRTVVALDAAAKGIIEQLQEDGRHPYATIGKAVGLSEAAGEDDDHLLEVLSTAIRSLPGVRSTETFVYLRLHEQLDNWGTR